MTTTTATAKRPPRRPEGGRVIWNGEPLTAAGDIVAQPDTQVMAVPGEEEDEDEDEEEEEDEEDEEDEQELAVVDAPPVAPVNRAPPRPPTVHMDGLRPPPGRPGPDIIPTQAELRKAKEEVDQTIAEKMAGYDLSRGEYTFTLMRVKPVLWKGKEIDGHLGQYEAPLTEPEVKALFGGGGYRWQVYGPDPKNPTRKTMHRPIPFKISGDPLVVDTENAQGTDISLFRDVMKQRNEEVERMRKETEAARVSMEKKAEQAAQRSESATKEILDVVLNLVNPKGAKDAALAEQRLMEQRAQNEREERRKENEAAERRHKESMEAVERRFQQTLQESKQQHEKEMERMREENRRAAELAKNSEKTSTSSMEAMMKWQAQQAADNMQMQAKLAADADARTREANTALMTQLQTLNSTKEEFLLRMVDKKDEDPMEKMLKLKQFMDMFNPGEKPKDGWERAFEAFEKIGPNVVPGIMGAFAASRAAPAAAQPRFIPGTVAAVDLPSNAALPAPARRKKRRRPGQPGQPTTAGGQPTTNQVPAVAGPVGIASGEYPPVDVVTELAKAPAPAPQGPVTWVPIFPPEDMVAPEEILKVLIGNLEQAAQHDWDAGQMFRDIVQKFPPAILELLKMVPPEEAIKQVTGGVPEDWALRSIRGQGLITDLLTMLRR